MDTISNLPDELLCHIGSFLSAKEAAFASVLSKRWGNLFTIIPRLHFDGSVVSDGGSLKDFVDGVLALPASSRVRKLSLKCNHVTQFDEQINRCLCNVVKRGVLVLKLEIKVAKGGCYSLPFEVFTCKTVSTMKLGSGFTIDLLPDDAFLPALKTLFLDSVRFCDSGGCCAFETLLSASPVLEELVIDGINWELWKWSCNVSSPTLRRLTIRREEWYSKDESIRMDSQGLAYDFDSMSLDTPCLTYLEYSDYVPKEYLVVNLTSLVEAELNLRAGIFYAWDEDRVDIINPMNLINGFKNVEILHVTFQTTDMFHAFREAIPVFEKLSQLSLSLSEICWVTALTLIKKSPNLKTLIIDGSLHYGRRQDEYLCDCVSEYSFLLSCPLEVLKINYYAGSIKELTQVKHFLEKLSSLKLLEVHARVSGDKELQVMEDLLMLPKASPNCKIKVTKSYKSWRIC